MELKMKTASNIAAAVGMGIVLGSFVLNAAGLTQIDMNDALKAGGFVKAVFLPVDASIWITHIFGKSSGGVSGGIINRDENNG
jgi:glycerol uptake facilitator-like aquaporin